MAKKNTTEDTADESTADDSDMRSRAHEGVDKVMDKADTIRTSSEQGLANLKMKGVMAKKNFDEYIKKNPEKSVLIAVGAGALAGAVIATAMKKKRAST